MADLETMQYEYIEKLKAALTDALIDIKEGFVETDYSKFEDEYAEEIALSGMEVSDD